jgi:hypothetical protein
MTWCRSPFVAGTGYPDGMARRSDELHSDSSVEVSNTNADTSIEALAAWIAELEREDGWIDLPTTAAQLIAEDRAVRGS